LRSKIVVELRSIMVGIRTRMISRMGWIDVIVLIRMIDRVRILDRNVARQTECRVIIRIGIRSKYDSWLISYGLRSKRILICKQIN